MTWPSWHPSGPRWKQLSGPGLRPTRLGYRRHEENVRNRASGTGLVRQDDARRGRIVSHVRPVLTGHPGHKASHAPESSLAGPVPSQGGLRSRSSRLDRRQIPHRLKSAGNLHQRLDALDSNRYI